MPKSEIINPMLATLVSKAPVDGYSYEIKWDGVRAITYISNRGLRILSRNNLDITHRYPELTALAKKCKHNLILDGEIIALDHSGRPSFGQLQHRMLLKHATDIEAIKDRIPIRYVIFDLLHLKNRSLLEFPYLKRREQLEKLKLDGPNWSVPPFYLDDPEALLQETRKNALEGIIAKRNESLYTPGVRSKDWLKIKNKQAQELVIAGYEKGNGGRLNSIGALLLGYYSLTRKDSKLRRKPQELIFCGKCGTGYSNAVLAELLVELKKRKSNENPFANHVPTNNQVVCRPELVGEFKFTEWTVNNTLRHPSFKGLRLDKSPQEVVREVPVRT